MFQLFCSALVDNKNRYAIVDDFILKIYVNLPQTTKYKPIKTLRFYIMYSLIVRRFNS